MKPIKIGIIIFVIFTTFTGCDAKIKNAKIETYKVWGNCSMCKKTIETATNIKGITKGDWNKDTKIISITFDSTKTNSDEILKRIGLAGYDNESYYAPDDSYSKLQECCQYKRRPKPIVEHIENGTNISDTIIIKTNDSSEIISPLANNFQSVNSIIDIYFSIKDALIKSDAKTVNSIAKVLITNINEIKLDNLNPDAKSVWGKISNNLKIDAEKISGTSNIEKQRTIFMDLTKNIVPLLKVSNQKTVIYLQHCPMYNNGAGADWLSKDKIIKNPYYGTQMINCGSIIETIK